MGECPIHKPWWEIKQTDVPDLTDVADYEQPGCKCPGFQEREEKRKAESAREMVPLVLPKEVTR